MFEVALPSVGRATPDCRSCGRTWSWLVMSALNARRDAIEVSTCFSVLRDEYVFAGCQRLLIFQLHLGGCRIVSFPPAVSSRTWSLTAPPSNSRVFPLEMCPAGTCGKAATLRDKRETSLVGPCGQTLLRPASYSKPGKA